MSQNPKLFRPLLLQEYSLQDLRGYISHITAKYRRERDSLRGQELRVAKLAYLDPETNTGAWYSVPTHQQRPVKVVTRGYSVSSAGLYTMLVQWNFDPEVSGEWRDMEIDAFNKIILETDVKLWCSCMAFLWQGMAFKLTKLGSAVYPQPIPDPVWGPRHHDDNITCKHLTGLIDAFFTRPGDILREIHLKILR